MFHLEIFIRSFLHICTTPVFKLMLSKSANFVADEVERERTALLQAGLLYLHYLVDISPIELSTV